MKPKSIKKVYIDLVVIILGFSILAYLFKIPYLYIGSGIAAVSAIHPKTARMVSKIWEFIGKTLGKINTTILLSIFFIVFIVPFSLLYQITRKKNKTAITSWNTQEPKPIDFSKPY